MGELKLIVGAPGSLGGPQPSGSLSSAAICAGRSSDESSSELPAVSFFFAVHQCGARKTVVVADSAEQCGIGAAVQVRENR